MGLPTVEHVLYIPVVLLLGIVIGWMMGQNSARADLERKRKRSLE